MVLEIADTVDDVLGGSLEPSRQVGSNEGLAEARDALAEAHDEPITVNDVRPVEAASLPKRKKTGFWQAKNKQFDETGRAEFIKALLETDQAEFTMTRPHSYRIHGSCIRMIDILSILGSVI